jgi:hypothetical protein
LLQNFHLLKCSCELFLHKVHIFNDGLQEFRRKREFEQIRGGQRSQSAVSDFGTKEEEGRGQGDGRLTGGFLVLSIHRY